MILVAGQFWIFFVGFATDSCSKKFFDFISNNKLDENKWSKLN